MPPRRTRQVAPPAPVTDAELPFADADGDDVPAAFKAPSPRARQARRVQSATADQKVRLAAGERAKEVASGVLTMAIAGRDFRLADSIGLMPMMEWVVAADEVDVRNAATLISFYRVLQDLVHPDDWKAFCAYTRECKCTDDELLAFQSAAMEAMAARPTGVPATS